MSRKKSKKSTALVVAVKTSPAAKPSVQRKNKKSSKKNQNGKANGRSAIENRLIRYYESVLLYPDLAGPRLLPGANTSGRYVPGMDRTRIVLSGPASNAFNNQAVLMRNTPLANTSSAYQYAGVPTDGDAFGAGTAVNTGVKFPASNQILDAGINGACMIVSYTGSTLNCTGEILMGTVPDNGQITSDILNGATTTQLAFYPEVIRMPLASLIDKPLRIAMRHASPSAWALNGSGTPYVDVELPFIVVSQMSTGCSVAIDLVRNFRCRSAVGGSEVPFSYGEEGARVHDAAFEEACSLISQRPNTVTELVPGGQGESFFESMMPSKGVFASVGGTLLSGYLSNRYLSHTRGGRFQGVLPQYS